MKQKEKEGKILSRSLSLLKLGHLSSPALTPQSCRFSGLRLWDLHPSSYHPHIPAGSQAFGLGLNGTTGFPGSPASESHRRTSQPAQLRDHVFP